jgi:hypothetical protein
MRLYIQAALGLMLLVSITEAKFEGGYIGGGLGTGWGTYKYKQPPHKTYDKDGAYSGMAPAEINTTSSWEIFHLSAVVGYGVIIAKSNYYFDGELRGNIKLMNSGHFISKCDVLGRFGCLPTSNILMYVGAGLGLTQANVNKISDGDIAYMHTRLATGVDISLANFMQFGPFVNWDIALDNLNEFKYNLSVGIKLDFVYEF